MKQLYFALLIGFLSLALSKAQNFTVATSLDPRGFVEPEVLVSNIDLAELKLNGRLAGGISGPLELGLGARYTNSLGPLGNVIVLSQNELNTLGQFHIALAGSGVIGPVAGSLSLTSFNVPYSVFSLETALTESYRSFTEGLGFSLGGQARYRLDRTTILDGELELSYLLDSGVSAELSAAYNLLKFVDRDDAAIKAAVYASPGFDGGYGALGFAYDVNRSDWPNLVAELWLGAGSAGVWPGVRLELKQDLTEEQSTVGLKGAWEPYTLNRETLQLLAFVDKELDYGQLRFSLGGSQNADNFSALVKLAYSFDLPKDELR
ncbi:MAG: hypothetical protein KC422_05770 [Trueperaceae bacterium]|nr:hypothetical protein [Trueperaceae bacterium]